MKSYINTAVAKLKNKFKTNNPFELIKALGINLVFENNMGKLKGFYTVINRERYIVINSNLDEYTQKIVAAHELGHDQLHRALAKNGALQEFVIYDMKSRPEYEANVFASLLLIDDNEVYDLVQYGYDMAQIASILNTDINLLGIKLGNMNTHGDNFNIGITPKNNFLGD